MKFSPSTLGWYPDDVKYAALPDDCVSVSESLYQSLKGKQIEAGHGGLPREAKPSTVNSQPTKPMIVSALQKVMDDEARSLGYDDLKTAITYRGDPNPKFASEAESFFLWRSAVWTKAYEYLDQNPNGSSLPSIQDAISLMPARIER